MGLTSLHMSDAAGPKRGIQPLRRPKQVGQDGDSQLAAEAWNFLRSYISGETKGSTKGKHEPSARVHTIAFMLGYSKRQVDNWLDDGGPPKQAGRVIIELYQNVKRNIDPQDRISVALCEILDIKHTHEIEAERFLGEYQAMRLDSSNSLITGDFSIFRTRTGGTVQHSHDSVQKIERDSFRFRHSGPVVVSSGKLYCLGVGQDSEDRYFRPIIFDTVTKPREVPMYGILLTETANSYRPLAALTALVHKDLLAVEGSEIYNRVAETLKGKAGDREVLMLGRIKN